ncbi:MAG: hypothetical protein H6797_01045 [Candidatus Nomurabacteria bacterium]|nr:MAG: hypothetical protein H6797_01045 [Candidatus Nomurabacteria bacterium]
MQRARHIIRGVVIYLFVVIFAGGAPLSTIVSADTAQNKKHNYTYNTADKHWSDEDWTWNKATGKYVKNTSVSPSPSDSPAPTSDTTPPDTTAKSSDPAPAGDATVTDSTNAAATTNDNNNVGVTNNLNSNTGSGDAGVVKNTTAGDAQTGDANGSTTIINSVHSTVGNGDTSGIAHFTMNLYGDITGDISIGPNINNATIDKNTNLSSKTNVNNNDTLVNNQTLKSTSGNATVSGNTTAGSAKSGNANTVADVMNLIDTIIAANKSFIGTVNIYGNLNGDILVSPDFIPQLLASNAQVYGNYNLDQTANINDNQSIVNNVKLNATSGTATVSGNTTAGTAKSGNAQTNLTILNLTGHQVDAKKSLLVFVNVLGKWVGMIVDAPGATSAALGSGVISDTTNISDTANLNNNAKIINNLDLSSASGDATVTKNTTAGDAVTGNATASANIANISTSQFNLSDWFGVLFINVYGTWIGSFGINTAAGTITPLSGDAVPSAGARIAALPTAGQLMHFGYTPATQSHATVAGVSGSGSKPTGGKPFTQLSGLRAPSEQLRLIPVAPKPFEDVFSNILMTIGFGAAGISGALWLIRKRRPTLPTRAPHGGGLTEAVSSRT